MTITLAEFLPQLISNPVLAVTVLLVLGVILVNGWTDAPNAIATCVSTKSMSPKAAILMAAVFNFLGVFFMTMVNASVAATIYKMVDFGGVSGDALVALCAALFAIVVWAVAAWCWVKISVLPLQPTLLLPSVIHRPSVLPCRIPSSMCSVYFGR